MKFITYKKHTIRCAFDFEASSDGFKILAVPESLRKVAGLELLKNYEVRRGRVVHKRDFSSPLIVWIAPWDSKTSIGEYAALLEPFLKLKFPNLVKLNSSIGEIAMGDAILEIEPDIVLIEHSFGTFYQEDLWETFLSRMQQIRTIVRFHSIYEQPNFHRSQRVVREALFHTEEQRVLFEARNSTAKTFVIPHGVSEFKDLTPDEIQHPCLVQFGFMSPYKGWEVTLNVAKEVMKDYPDLFVLLLAARNEDSYYDHQVDSLAEDLLELAESLRIGAHVSLSLGFLPLEELLDQVAFADVAIFPYLNYEKQNVYAASGAARIAIGCGVPVVTSKTPLFSDLAGVCEQGDTVEELAEKVKSLLSSKKASLERQADYLKATSWEAVAEAFRLYISQ